MSDSQHYIIITDKIIELEQTYPAMSTSQDLIICYVRTNIGLGIQSKIEYDHFKLW